MNKCCKYFIVSDTNELLNQSVSWKFEKYVLQVTVALFQETVESFILFFTQDQPVALTTPEIQNGMKSSLRSYKGDKAGNKQRTERRK